MRTTPTPGPSGDATGTPHWDALAHAIGGTVLLPGSEGYASHRAPAIALFAAVRPAAIVRCHATADVATALRFATRAGVPVAVRSGGHCFAGTSSTGGMLLDVRPLRTVSVSDGLAHVGAGARLDEVYDALAVSDLTLPAGCGPTVGISGLTLGGGLGVLGRLHGLTSDRLVGAELVLADGRIRRCDAHHAPELLWCLQGGGAPGVVTSLAFRPVAAPAASAFVIRWPFTAAHRAIAAWQSWAPDAPDVVYAELHVTAPADADVPPRVELSGLVADDTAGVTLLDGFVERVGSPHASAVTPGGAFRDAKRWLSGQGGGELSSHHPYVSSVFFDHLLPSQAIGQLVDAIGSRRPAGVGWGLDLLPMGGAYNRVAPSATAFAHRRDHFLLKCEATVPAESGSVPRTAARSWLSRVKQVMRTHGSGRAYRNFPEVHGTADYDGGNGQRLARIRSQYDPDGVFDPARRPPQRPATI